MIYRVQFINDSPEVHRKFALTVQCNQRPRTAVKELLLHYTERVHCLFVISIGEILPYEYTINVPGVSVINA